MQPWNTQQRILNFGKCGTEQFQKIRTDLGIGMSDEQLTRCADYCRTRLKRDPMIEELLFWDRLATQSANLATVQIRQMETKDPAIAQTYADLIRHRKELNPLEYSADPITVGKILSTATETIHLFPISESVAALPFLIKLKCSLSSSSS